MYRKIVTSIDPSGRTSHEDRAMVADTDLDADMAHELRRIGDIARSPQGVRIQSVEETRTTLVVIYVHGAVKVYHWVAE